MTDPFANLPRAIGGRFPLKHGHTGTPTYSSWQAMWKRCRSRRYKNHNGRGIQVCERWKSFANFLADMGPRSYGTTLDRFPNKNGNYEPTNCRWASWKQQQRNKRTNLILDGLCLAEWMEIAKVSRRTVSRRLEQGWPIAHAVSEPDRRGH